MSEEKSSSCYLLNLPCEDITFPHIFSRLAPVDLINLRLADKRFEPLVDCYLGRKIRNLDVWASCMTPKEFDTYAEALSDLRHFSIAYAQGISDGSWSKIFTCSPNLKHLDLSRSTVSGYTLQIAVTNCPNITCLHLGSCSWVDDACMEVIALHLNHLECLDISCTGVISKMPILLVCQSNPAMKTLNLSRLNVVDKNLLKGIYRLCERITDLRLRLCPKVTTDVAEWIERHVFCKKNKNLRDSEVKRRGRRRFENFWNRPNHKGGACTCCPILTDIRHGQYTTEAKAKELLTIHRDAPPCTNQFLADQWDIELYSDDDPYDKNPFK